MKITGEYDGQKTVIEGKQLEDILEQNYQTVKKLGLNNTAESFLNHVTYGITDHTSDLSYRDAIKIKAWYRARQAAEK